MSNDPGASPGESTSEPKLIRVTLKSSGETRDCQVAEKSTVAELKNEASCHFLVSKEQVLLVFAGKILKDPETLLQHGIQSGDVLHVVVKRPELGPTDTLPPRSVAPGSSAPDPAPAGASESSGGITLQPLLRGLRGDLTTLLGTFGELPQHFQQHPELLFQVVQSSPVQSLLSKECNPLTVAFVLGVSSLVSLRAMQSRAEKEEEFSDQGVAEVLEEPSVQNILASTKEMAQFLSETPELRTFAQETPQFGRLLSLSGLTKMMVIYKKLPGLAGTIAPDMGLEADVLDDLQSFRQLFVDIRQILSGPEVQDELEERMLRHTIETSPSLIQLAKENARIGHLLSNPKVMGEIIRYIQKPGVRKEMDRHCDRILSNIESFPGGYNILQSMYKEIEEPIWSAMEQQRENPLATQGGSPASSQAGLPTRIENRTPLPDPWVPRQLPARPRAKDEANHRRGTAEEGNLRPEKVSKGTQVDFSLESSQTEDLPGASNASPESSPSSLQDRGPPATESPASQAAVVQSQDLPALPGQPNASPREGPSSQELGEAEDHLETPPETPPGSSLP